MPSCRKCDDDDDDWKPPRAPVAKPKNFALLEARKKKRYGSKNFTIRCQTCKKKFADGVQLKNHVKTHGRVSNESYT